MRYYKCRKCGRVIKAENEPFFCAGPPQDEKSSFCYGVIEPISDERGLAHDAGFKI